MSLEMTLEADSRLGREDAKKLLSDTGAIDFEEKSDGFVARFPDSNMSVLFRDGLKHGNALTEAIEDRGWLIGSRMTFRYMSNTFEKCDSELRLFVSNLAKESKAFFVVAFQYEEVWALSDEAGLRFMK